MAAPCTDIIKKLNTFSAKVSKQDESSETEDMASSIQSDAEEAAAAVMGDSAEEEEKIPIETTSGAKAMALALSRIFGGWRGGCRLSPSANRVNAHHLTVFCGDPKEMGERMIKLRDHLLSEGYKEIAEGVFQNGNKSIYQGRSYMRRGGRPMAFMLTIEVR